MRGRLSQLRDWQRGATGVEYALILSVLVVGSIGAINFVETETETQVLQQEDCVRTRPPPVDCQLQAVNATTTPTIDPSAPPTTAPVVTTLPTTAAAWSGTSALCCSPPNANGTWSVSTQITFTQEGIVGTTTSTGFVGGAVVTIEWTILAPAGISTRWYTTCVTDSAGVCNVDTVAPNGATQIRGQVISVESSPPVEPDDIPTASWTRVGV